ncbi:MULTISPECIES: hypothetical protein [unclassified Corynebacterium]|uniref:hypothetical protein n=1 Tax=unclassified Corynebacterium TaxID=2624378 RepID=UPI0029C9F21C|nr:MULTISPECIES: hypothetical protein [unclassified Corynebacterium]WPF66244.1 hypothetical protein OLX12_00465 [Corynebacterium sp. 22KM0430]WPF68734.1 hypothetical protein OLW90_00465 [Corynebacterium sp. 21KM1197]
MRPEPTTVLLRAASLTGEVHRHIGIDASRHLHDLHRVLGTCFGLIDAPTWGFQHSTDAGGRGVDGSERIDTHLGAVGEHLTYEWGLWQIRLSVVGVFVRDAHTPWALCVGGSGSFRDAPFDLATINAALMGGAATREVMDRVRPEVRSVLSRGNLMDFVPLLQALDVGCGFVGSTGSESGAVAGKVAELPVEKDQVGADAFWCALLGFACFSGEAVADEVMVAAMEALGYGDCVDEARLSGRVVRAWCAESLDRLAAMGGCGENQAPPVERLELYRVLLSGDVFCGGGAGGVSGDSGGSGGSGGSGAGAVLSAALK